MKDKNVAGLLAFFLGGIGLHRFYIGQIGLGFVYLLFSWTLIPAIIGFIDAIVFWAGSQESFDSKYNKKRKLRIQQPNGLPQSNAFVIVGVNNYQDAYTKCKDGDELLLKPEPENQFDNKAVAIFHKSRVEKIGYISKKQNEKLFAYLSSGKEYKAQMIGKNNSISMAGCAVFATEIFK